MIDRSRLTNPELGELLRALIERENALKAVDVVGVNEDDRRDARWRLFIVKSLLAELGG